MARYYARIGEDNTAWLIKDLAPAHFRSDAAQDIGHGYIALDEEALDALRDLREEEDGYIAIDDEGPVIWIEGEGYPLLPDEQLFNDNAATLAGMTASAWRGTVARHDALIPDGRKVDKGHARPWWWTSTILAWQAGRPGRGARTDLRHATAITATYETPADQFASDWDWADAATEAWTRAAREAGHAVQITSYDVEHPDDEAAIVDVAGCAYVLTVRDGNGREREVRAELVDRGLA